MAPLDPKAFRAPFLDKQQCWSSADSFRAQYAPSGAVPVDVLAIAEFDLGFQIRPIMGLREDADVDALLLSDCTTLIVDHRQYMDARFINRLRFSMAHEIGHYVLHRDILRAIPRATPAEWIEFMRDMPEREYGFLEFHANEFAGRLLVPLPELKAEFEKALQEAEGKGLQRQQLNDAHLEYLCKPLGRRFDVSADVIEKRLIRENLWPAV
jgi:hypothetical protein